MSVLVIGAGPSGLVTLKELLDEGIEALCVEAKDRAGGVFDHGRDRGGVYDSTLLTVSNYFMAFSSLPPDPLEPRKYWTHNEYFDYLARFVRHFGLSDRLRFNTQVEDVRLNGAQVQVTLRSEGRVWSEQFDAVAICTGTHQIPKYPDIEGLDGFTGVVTYSSTYKNAERFRGQRVVCIGIGETAADVSHEISLVASATMLSMRHYPSVIERYPFGGLHPNDAYTTRGMHTLGRSALQWSTIKQREATLRETDSQTEALLCDWAIRSGGLVGQWFTKNEIFLRDIVEGRLHVNLSGVRRVDGGTVIFRDGACFDADVIMCNTGYRDEFPLSGVTFDSVRDLYKHAFHPELGSRVAFIGWARPEVGGIPTCSELTARYFALLRSGKRTLPDRATLQRLISSDRQAEEAHFVNTPMPASVVRYVEHCDAMARLIGCHPLENGQLRDPELLVRLWFGSLIAAQYRLTGPHAAPEEAREVLKRIPIAMGRRELLMMGGEVALRRVPFASRWLNRRAAQRARAAVEEYVREHGGEALLPDGGRVVAPIGARDDA